ncbi:MAG: RluA family pseudouridine synthase [Patescibacteria group bacterium]
MLRVTVLHEDNDVLVVNKPAGLVVHSDGRTKEPTLVDWIVRKYPSIRGVGDSLGVKSEELKVKSSERSLDRSGIVHRLDRETSGALIVAKNQSALFNLRRQFKKQEVRKTYHAFVYGRVKHDEGVIDRPIARSRANPVLWSATRGRKGEEREAITEYRVLARENGFTFLELSPRTGRTHQLRVHLKAINYPIVSDKLYSNNEPALGFKRLALHSRAVSFVLPTSGKRITVEAPYPKDFEGALKIFKSKAQSSKS